MPRGNQEFHDVYLAVKQRFPHFCDDLLLCSEVCTDGNDTPEWQHRVRAALETLKRAMVVLKGNRRRALDLPLKLSLGRRILQGKR